MKAMVAAGGCGSRLRPSLSAPLNKHLAPVGTYPMIGHVLRTLVSGGVTDAVIAINWKHPGLLVETIASLRLPLNICYVYDPEDIGAGPARHILLAEPWLKRERDFVLILGDAIFFTPLDFITPRAPHIWTMPIEGDDDPSKYGQVKILNGRVAEIEEKPRVLFSPIIQTGVWKLPCDIFDRVRASERLTDGELHVGDVTRTYVEEGSVTHTPLPPHSYIDCGTPEALMLASQRMMAAELHVPVLVAN